MSLEIEIIMHKKYVEATVSGDYNTQEAVDKFTLVLSACKIANLSKVLIDFRKLHGDIYAIQKIIYSLQIINNIIVYFAAKGRELQLAYVGKSPQISSAYEPGLEIVEREGFQALLTIDINEAIEWLAVNSN